MDSTVVAVFHQIEQARGARQELLNSGFDEAKLSFLVESAAILPEGIFQKLKSKLVHPPGLRECAILTLYGDDDALRKAMQLLRQHQPDDLKMQLTGSAAADLQPSARAGG